MLSTGFYFYICLIYACDAIGKPIILWIMHSEANAISNIDQSFDHMYVFLLGKNLILSVNVFVISKTD